MRSEDGPYTLPSLTNIHIRFWNGRIFIQHLSLGPDSLSPFASPRSLYYSFPIMSLLTGLLALCIAASISVVEASPQIRGPQAGRPGSRPGPGGWRGNGKSAGSPEYKWIFENPLPIPEVAQPFFTETINGRQIQYYEQEIRPFEKQVYPDLGTAKMIGYSKFASCHSS